MTLRIVTPRTGGLVTLDQAKAHLRVDTAREDASIVDLIETATDLVEAHVQRRYLAQQLEWVLPAWPSQLRPPKRFDLPVAGPDAAGVATEITAITYTDLQNAAQVWSADQYVVSPLGQTLTVRPTINTVLPLLGYDAAEAVVVAFDIGGLIDDVPSIARRTCLLAIGDLYFERETTNLSLKIQDVLASECWA